MFKLSFRPTRLPLVIVALAALAPLCPRAQAVPTTINYQGRLTDNTPLQNPLTATVNIQFEIWDVASGGTASPDRLWVEPASGAVPVTVTGGIFNVMLGGNSVPLPASVFNSANPFAVRYLQLIVNGETLAPRQKIGSTGNAMQAQNAYQAQSAQFATSAGDSGQLGGVAPGGYQLATTQSCAGGQFISAITAAGGTTCATPAANNLTPPVSLTYAGGSTVLTATNNGTGAALRGNSAGGDAVTAVSASGNGVYANSNGAGYGIYASSATGLAGKFDITNAANGNVALSATTTGAGAAIYATSASGSAGQFTNSNAANFQASLVATNTGSGAGLYATSTGSAAGQFAITSAANGNYALLASTVGGGEAFLGYTTGTAQAGIFQINNAANTGPALEVTTNGTGNGIYSSINNSNQAYASVYGLNSSAGNYGMLGTFEAGVEGRTGQGTFKGVWGSDLQGSGYGVYGSTTTGTGVAGRASSAAGGNGVDGSTAAATGAGVHASGSSTAGTALRLDNGGIRVGGAGVNTATPVFTQTTTAGNVSGDSTIITNPLTDGDPNAILIVTHNYNPGGVGGTVMNKNLGVWYTIGHWRIYFEDLSAMPIGVAFNVLVIKP